MASLTTAPTEFWCGEPGGAEVLDQGVELGEEVKPHMNIAPEESLSSEPEPRTAPNDLVATIDVERDSIAAIHFGEPS